MAKHARKSDHLQLVERPKTTTVEIPLPLLGAFANIERSFFVSPRYRRLTMEQAMTLAPIMTMCCSFVRPGWG